MIRAGLVLIMMIIAVPAWAEPDWTLQRDRKGITVWTALEEDHAIETYKGVIEVPAPPARVAQAIVDIEQFAQWAPDLREARALDNGLSYVAYAMPFPVKDRDLVQTISVDETGDGTIAIEMRAAPDGLPQQGKRVRVQDSLLRWQIEPAGDDASRVTCIGYSDPEGGVPSFVINMLIVEAPYSTLKALRAHFE